MTVYRYRSRQYYCVNIKDYVKISTILEWSSLPSGVKVLCHKTKNDITESTLHKARYLKERRDVFRDGP